MAVSDTSGPFWESINVTFFNFTSGYMPSSYQWYINISGGGDYIGGKITSNGEYVMVYAGSYVYLFNGSSYKPSNPAANPNKPIWEFEAYLDITSGDMSQDGKYIAVGDENGDIYLLDHYGNEIWHYTDGWQIGSVSISYDNKYICAIEEWGKLYLFSNSSNMPLWIDDSPTEYTYFSATFARDANIIITAGNYSIEGNYYYIWAKDTNNDTI